MWISGAVLMFVKKKKKLGLKGMSIGVRWIWSKWSAKGKHVLFNALDF